MWFSACGFWYVLKWMNSWKEMSRFNIRGGLDCETLHLKTVSRPVLGMCSRLSPGETVLVCAESSFSYCFNIISGVVDGWERASCQPQCPQFHCPHCSHPGTLLHFSRVTNPLWWTAQSRSHFLRNPLEFVFMHIFLQTWDVFKICHVLMFLWNFLAVFFIIECKRKRFCELTSQNFSYVPVDSSVRKSNVWGKKICFL